MCGGGVCVCVCVCVGGGGGGGGAYLNRYSSHVLLTVLTYSLLGTGSTRLSQALLY